jgi:glyoxylase-like metal-dependent hydrolase (beta-lactamase superfamily II)
MRRQMDPEFVRSFWSTRFPGQIPDTLTTAETLTADSFELEGEELRIVDLGHTDTDDTTALHVPSIGLVVAGDAVYNDVHLYLAESPASGRAAWLTALETIEALDPDNVVAGHKRAGLPDDPAIIGQTRRYIQDFDRLARSTSDALSCITPCSTCIQTG